MRGLSAIRACPQAVCVTRRLDQSGTLQAKEWTARRLETGALKRFRAASGNDALISLAGFARPPGSGGEVVAAQVHYLVPRRHEVFHELLLRVGRPIDFRKGAQLRVRTKDQVDPRAGPLRRLGLAVAALVEIVAGGEIGRA